MYFNFRKDCFEIAKENMTKSGVTIEDLREYGYCFLQEVYHNEIDQKIEIEIYELDCKTYLIRCVDDRCVMFCDITATKK